MKSILRMVFQNMMSKWVLLNINNTHNTPLRNEFRWTPLIQCALKREKKWCPKPLWAKAKKSSKTRKQKRKKGNGTWKYWWWQKSFLFHKSAIIMCTHFFTWQRKIYHSTEKKEEKSKKTWYEIEAQPAEQRYSDLVVAGKSENFSI